MILLLNLVLLFIDTTGPLGIAKTNDLKKEAQEAYQLGNYQKSAEKYSYIVDSLNIMDEKAIMNLANSYYKMEDTESALSSYQRLQESKDDVLKSQAYQQLGVLSKDPKTLEKALAYFKESIKSDPTNNDARYNYELVKKKLEQQQDQEQNQDDQNKDDQEEKDEEKENKDEQNKDQQEQNKDQQNKDDQKQDQENQENKEQDQQNQDQEKKEGQENEEKQDKKGQEEQQKEGEEGEEQEEKEQPQPGDEQEEGEEKEQQAPQKSTSEKLEEMNISEEKAKMILEALKNSEIQYIQQNRRKPSKRKDSNKPDW